MSTWTNVDWRATAVVNGERAIAAAIVWAALVGFGVLGSVNSKWYQILYMVPVIYLGLLPLGLIAEKFLNRGGEVAGFAGFIMLVVGLLVIVGDPLVWILHRTTPQAVPVAKFGIINRHLVLVVAK